MSRSPRARAFRAIRTIISPETCPDLSQVRDTLRTARIYVPVDMHEEVDQALFIVDADLRKRVSHLRSVLAALLVHTQSPGKTCPNCEELLVKNHNKKCHLNKLLTAFQGAKD